MNLNRGSILLCKVPMPSEDFKKYKVRPALVVSKDLNNERLHDVIIAVCTSNTSRSTMPTQYLIQGQEMIQTGIKVESVIKCESLLSINKSMVVKVLGKLSKESMTKVNECLIDALGVK